MDALNLLLAKISPYLRVLEVFVVILACVWLLLKVYNDGIRKVEVADTLARAAEHDKVVAETYRLQRVADQAKGDRDAVQKTLDAYVDAHPIGPVRLCNPSNQPARMPAVPAPHPSDDVPRPGPAPVQEVLGRDAGPDDIGPELATVVRAAGTLAGLYRQYQQQPEVGHANP